MHALACMLTLQDLSAILCTVGPALKELVINHCSNMMSPATLRYGMRSTLQGRMNGKLLGCETSPGTSAQSW